MKHVVITKYCPLCDAEFIETEDLTKHLQRKHAGNHFNLVCKQDSCSRKYSTIHPFIRHVRGHEKDVLFDQSEQVSVDSSSKCKEQHASTQNVGDVNNCLDNNYSIGDSSITTGSINEMPVEFQIIEQSSHIDLKESTTESSSISHIEGNVTEADKVLSYLYSLNNLPRNLISKILKTFQNYYKTYFDQIKITQNRGDIKTRAGGRVS